MTKPQTSAQRAQKSRDKKKALGQKEITFNVSQAEYDFFTKMGKLRAGCRSPYSANDYVAALVRLVLPLDYEKYQTQAKRLGMCGTCNTILPGGCSGVFKGQEGCYHTADYKQLEVVAPKPVHNSLTGALLEQGEFEMLETVIGRLHKFYDHSRDASQNKNGKVT
jgi:major membrane immunogen (membrane-anchored lipoprotein)